MNIIRTKTTNFFNGLFILIFLAFSLELSGNNLSDGIFSTKSYTMSKSKEAVASYDTNRIYHAMAKARRGEDIVIGFIGGSITAGYAASTTDKRYTNLVLKWWRTTFPNITVSIENVGIGGTGSDIGSHRLQVDLLSKDPDFIVVEFSVNDTPGDYTVKMMEGIVRQVLENDSTPGLVMLLLKQENGATAQASHKLVGEHYNVPMISFTDLIDAQLAEDNVLLHDIFIDGLHPVDIGMQYIADFINEELDSIYSHLPLDEDLETISKVLPDSLITDVFAHTFQYNQNTIIPSSNNGWTTGSTYWTASIPESEITFKLDGNAISLLYNKDDNTNWGQAEVWVDDGAHQTLDAYWTETWGPATVFCLVSENLSDGEHTLHVKITNQFPAGSSGHTFRLLKVLKAGNIISSAPIAVPGDNTKALINTTIDLDGSLSFDPDGDNLVSFSWSVVVNPAGSAAQITNNSNELASFVPDVPGLYKIGLIVNDGNYTSVIGIKTILIKTSNTPPAANGGSDVNVGTNKNVLLDGSQSTDPDGDSISYTWRIISQPGSSNVSILKGNTQTPSVFVLEEGEYKIGLIVNDSIVPSAEDTIIINSVAGYSSINEIESGNYQLNLYPNPAKDEIHIKFSLMKESQIIISIFTLNGKKIQELMNQKLDSGDYDLTHNLESLIESNSSYIIKFDVNDDHFCSKLIIN